MGKRRRKVVPPVSPIVTNVIGIHAVALIIATELLAEASEVSTAEDWLMLIMAKTKHRYESMSAEEMQDCCQRIMRCAYPKSDFSG
jgi:hypothetical protein